MPPLTSGLAIALAALVGMPCPGDDSPFAGPGRPSVVVAPAEVVAGMFYNGARVRVTAGIPEEVSVAITCVGEEGTLHLNRKGKALGLVWMNRRHLSLERVPTLYLLHTSAALKDLAAPDALARLDVGFDALRSRVRSGEDDSSFYPDLVRLKQRDGLWGIAEGSVDIRRNGRGSAEATTEFFLPARAGPGRYEVRVLAFADGKGTLLATGELRVNHSGIARFFAALAVEHGLLYGLLAVFSAAGVGLMTGVAFGLGSGKAH